MLEILNNLWGARNRVGMGCRNGPPGYIGWRNDSLESILGLLKNLKIRAQYTYAVQMLPEGRSERSKTERGSEGPGLALSAGAHTHI